jgi:molecular chaperone DnaK
MRDNADKVPADVKGEVEAAIADTKSALGGTDVEAIKNAAEKLATTSQKLGTALYEQAQAAQAASGAAGSEEGGAQQESDDVVDAEIVDEGKNG